MTSNSTKEGISYPLDVQGLLPMNKIKGTGKEKKISSQQLFASKSNCDSRYSLRNSDFKMPRFNTIKYGKHSIRTMALSSGRNLHEKNYEQKVSLHIFNSKIRRTDLTVIILMMAAAYTLQF